MYIKKLLKRILSTALACAVVIACLPTGQAGAAQPELSGSCGENVTWALTPGEGAETYTLTISATDADNRMDDFNLPTHAEGAPWKAYISQISTLVVEEGVKNLGDRACYGATALNSISIPASVTSTGNGVFRGCTELAEAIIPGPVTDMDKNLLYGCIKLKKAEFGDGTTALAQNTLSGCSALEELKIPVTVNGFYRGTFTGVAALTKIYYGGSIAEYKALLATDGATALRSASITAVCSDGSYIYSQDQPPEKPSGTTGDVDWTFDPETATLTLSGTGATASYTSGTTPSKAAPWLEYMDDIKKLVVESGVTGLGARLLYGADNLVDVTLPNTLISIGEGTFRECPALRTITIPNSVTTLGRAQFYLCTSLESAVLGGSYGKLDQITFSGCTALKRLFIPGSVTALEKNALQNCNSLEEIVYGGTVESWKALLTSVNATPLHSDAITVTCSDGSFVYGRNDLGDGLQYSLENGTLILSGSGEMGDFDSAENVPWAADAGNVHTVVIKSGVKKIGSNAFGGCTNLAQIHYIGTEEGWQTLQAATGEGNAPLFAHQPVFGLAGTCGKEVNWRLSPDETVLTISGLGPMMDYAGADELPWRYSAGQITTVSIADGVTTLGDHALLNCRSLTQVSLPGSVTTLGTYALGGCISLESINIPEGVRIIGAKTFSACSGLKTVYLPLSLQYVDMKAFNYDSAITDVYYAGTLKQWDRITLSNSATGNKELLKAALHVQGTPVDVRARYDDVSEDWYASSIQFLVEEERWVPSGTSFGITETVGGDAVAAILYRQTGSPGMYDSPQEWAVRCGILERGNGQAVSLADLALTLYRTAAYNGRGPAAGDGPLDEGLLHAGSLPQETRNALSWAFEAGYFDVLLAHAEEIDVTRMLTWGEGATVLAAYLGSDNARADRYGPMLDTVRAAMEQDGDGKLYVLTPALSVPNITTKSGDCALVVFPDGQTMLVDSGVSHARDHVLGMVRSLGLTSLDHLVITHPHADHTGNALAVAQYLYSQSGSVGTYYYSGYAFKTQEPALAAYLEAQGVQMNRDARAGDKWTIGGVTLDLYNPSEESVENTTTCDESVNNLSLAIKFTYGSSTYLSCGDLYASKELELVEKYGNELQADVLKSNHHGLYTSNSMPWLKAVKPLVMITHNDDIGGTVLAESVTDMGAAYFSAGLDGAILVTMDDEANYDVITQYDTILRRNYRGSIGAQGTPEVEPPAVGSGSSNTTRAKTVKNADGSITRTVTNPQTGTVTATTTWPDGSKTVVETRKDGSVTTTATRADGVSVKAVTSPEGETTAIVTLPGGMEEAVVSIPVPGARAGTVAIMVGLDSAGIVVKKSVAANGVVTVPLQGSAELRFEDRGIRFADVPEDNWAAEAIAFVTARGLFQGTGSGFAPTLPMTRGMLAAVLYRLEDSPQPSDTVEFNDVKDGAWYTQAATWAGGAGIITGTGLGFEPEAALTRESLALIPYRYAVYAGADVSTQSRQIAFADADTVSPWAAETGILTGKPGNRLDPGGAATRAEVAVMLARYLSQVK